jgi:predicted GTPase
VQQVNPDAKLIEADFEIEVDRPDLISGRRVLVVEDGPTIPHGGMAYGAGKLAAAQYGAGELVDPRSSAVGSIAEALREYPHIEDVLPALGYSVEQRGDLTQTIENSDAEVVVDASPARLDQLLQLSLPVVRVRYVFRQVSGPELPQLVDEFLTG